MVLVRKESSADIDAIDCVVVDAFANSEFGHQGEAELVRKLRDHCSDVLSLVALDGDRIIGHILFSPVELYTDRMQAIGMGLAPVSVASDRQRCGVGSKLIEFGLRELESRRCPFVVVLGHPDYYCRFGFLPASQFGIQHGFPGLPQDYLFIKAIDLELSQLDPGGRVRYRPEFGTQ